VPAGLLLADRVLFLPSIGLTLAFASMSLPVAKRWQAVATAISIAAVCLLGVLTVQRREVWRDADTFFASMTRDNPGSYRAWYVRAMHEKAEGHREEAVRHL